MISLHRQSFVSVVLKIDFDLVITKFHYHIAIINKYGSKHNNVELRYYSLDTSTNLHQKHTKNKMRLPWFHCTDSHLFLKDWYGFENLFQYHYYSGTKKVRGPIEIGDHFSYSQDFVRARTWLRSMTNSDLWFSNRIGFVSSYSKLVLRVYIPTFSLALRISSTKTGSSSPSLGLPAYNSWYWN